MPSQRLIEQHIKNSIVSLQEDKGTVKKFLSLYNVEPGPQALEKLEGLEMGIAKTLSPEDVPIESHKDFKELGLFDKKNEGLPFMPLREISGKIKNMLYLSVNGNPPRLTGKGGLANISAFTAFRKINVTDSITDFMHHYFHVKENVSFVIQTEVMPEDFTKAVMNSTTVEEITMLFNSPRWEHVEPLLKDTDVKIYNIALPGRLRIREFLKDKSANRFKAYVEAEKAKILKEQKEAGSEQEEVRLKLIEDFGEIRFESDDRIYRVRGFNKDGFEKIVQMIMEVEGKSLPDKVDLSRSQARGRFANIAGAEFEMSAELIRDDLTFIYKTLDSIQDIRFREKTGIKKAIHTITTKEAHRTIDLLTSRDLLDEILMKDTERLGYVGEEINKKLFYLSATSRLTGESFSVLDISPPGTGKSFGLSNIMGLMPPDEVLKYSRLSPRALYYKSESELKGKVLYIEEIVGMEESLEPIRMLLSSGELAVSVVEKDSRTGTLRTVERRVSVDIPILSSGVRDIFDEETLSRFILTYNDVGTKHMERVLRSQAQRYTFVGGRVDLQRDRILKRNWNYQKVMDANVGVKIPFADKIMLDPVLDIVTRKQDQYLRIIYNIAFLRQHSREKKKELEGGREFLYIEAAREDVVTANEILSYVFQFIRSDLTKRLHDAYHTILKYCMEQVKEKRIGLYEFKFSRREIREYAGWKLTTAKEVLDDLNSLEYVRRVRGSQGKKYIYTVVPYDGCKAGDLMLLDPDTP